ncbi:MAG: extracellular solute-binding protein [Candidatus Rokubacteria bacterium]|nr:extracellular solute-binding protein [Candidatus Rokubacteria bacterium]
MSAQRIGNPVTRRVFVRTAALGFASVAGGATPPLTVAAAAQAPPASKRFAGTTIRVSMFDTAFPRGLEKLLPQFSDLTGIKVEFERLGFPVFVQRSDLELSGATGAVDAMTLVFAQSGRWIGAGWAEDLAPFVTRSGFDLEDLLAGPLATMKRGPKLYGIPWLADSQLMLYRSDLISRPPDSFDELLETAKRVHSPAVAGYMPAGKVALNWIFPTFLFGFGGRFFADPPVDLRPALAAPEAIQAAEYWAGRLIRSYGAPGSTNFEDAEQIATMQQGRAAIWIHSLGQLTAALDEQKSRVADRVAFALPPRGAAGRFPQVASHGLMIPVASKKKEAAWEFIKWATSRETMRRVALESQHAAVTRASVLNDPAFKKKYRLAGSDVPALHEAALKAAGAGYMAYRTVPEFPAVTERVVIALSAIAAGQTSAREAMTAANGEVVQILERAGHRVR